MFYELDHEFCIRPCTLIMTYRPDHATNELSVLDSDDGSVPPESPQDIRKD